MGELERDCLDPSVSVSTILRKAKVIASKLDLSDLKQWIESELNGYECSFQELPPHRKGIGSPKFRNPHYGWCPIMTDDGWFGEAIRTIFMPQPIAELEELGKSGSSETLVMEYNPIIQEEMQKQLPARMQCALHFSKSQVRSALDFVRNRTLDWTLELQNRGISGEGHSFNISEKQEARMVTNNIYGGNIGVLGNVGGDANNSNFVSSDGVDSARLKCFLDQAIPASAGLDADTRKQVQPLLEDLRAEAEGEPEPGRVTKLVQSLRTVLEGASGNLVASAILAALAS